MSDIGNGTGHEGPSGAPTTPPGRDDKGSPTRRLLVVVAVVLAIALVGGIWQVGRCDKPTSTTLPPTPDSTLSPVQQKVLADYRAFWDAYLVAGNPVRPDHPLLQKYATGEELKKVVESFTALKAGNEVIKGTVDLNPRVASVNGNQAVVRDCGDDHTGIYEATTGERKDTDDPRKQLSTASLVLIDDTWRVSRVSLEGFDCTAP